MIRVAVQSLRARWVSFLGTVVALVLGVAQVAAMGLLLTTMLDLPDRPVERFAEAPAVVYPTDPTWNSAQHDLGVRSLAAAKGISDRLHRAVGGTGETVVDRAFYAQLENGPADQVGHPWPTARFGGYQLTDGWAPRTDREIVVAAGQARIGDEVTVLTSERVTRYTVSGTVDPVGWENAVFFTDAEAARLSPRVDALVALGPLDRVHAVVDRAGTDAEVLTGQDRHRADPSTETDRERLDNTITLVPVMATVAGTTAVFVVASTFAFAVVQRRRELALLRAAGATPRQVRRMVRNEALLVGVLASAAGTALGVPGAGLLADMLISMGISPPWFTPSLALRPAVLAPLAGAFLVGVLVALGGAAFAARRAGGVPPVDALREAAADDQTMTRGRRLLGVAGLVLGVGWAAWTAVGDPAGILSPTTHVISLMVPVLAAAVLAPLAVAPLTRLLMWPWRRSSGATAMLVRESALTARRRTAATAAPILLAVGLTASLFAATDSLGAARDSGLRDQVRTEFALAPDGTPGVSRQVIDRVSAVDGVRVVAPLLTTIYTRDEDRLDENDGLVVDPAALADTTNLDVIAGSLSDVDDDSMAVPDQWGMDLDSSHEVLMADGAEVTLRVAAVYHAVRGSDVAYLPTRFAATAKYARDGLARRAFVSLKPGTDRAAAIEAIQAAVSGTGTSFLTSADLVASETAYARGLTEVRQRSTGMIIMLFCFIAILNTLLMATAERRRDLSVLRLAGATPRQVMRFFLAESLLVSALGVTLALAATAVNLAGLWGALRQVFGVAPIVVPFPTIIAIAFVSTLLAIAGTVAPVRAALRARTVERDHG